MAGIVMRNQAFLRPCRKFRVHRSTILSRSRVDDVGGANNLSGDSYLGRAAKLCLGVLAGATGTCGIILYFLDESVKAAAESMKSLPSYPWSFNGVFTSFDHSALRRGWEVYRMVCHTCHSLRFVRFMDLIGVSHTAKEVKAIAAEYEVQDGPDEEGNYYTRPGKPVDKIPSPYPNEEAARYANFGSYPPDLTYAVNGRRNGTNYMFSLLTGWMDPPAGVTLNDGQYFNIYFAGGATGMAGMLYDGIVEYDDGTPATPSQMAKDVTEFLNWTASQEHDTRKLMTIKIAATLVLLLSLTHLHRRVFSQQRSKQIAYVPKR